MSYKTAQEQRESIQKLKQQLVEELSGVVKQLDELLCKQRALERELKVLNSKPYSSEEEELEVKQCLVKELHSLIQTILSVQQTRDKLVEQQCWVKGFKYELHKGIVH